MVTVSILSIVLLIFVLHTILTHLLNWLTRLFADSEAVALMILTNLLEIVITVLLLKHYLK